MGNSNSNNIPLRSIDIIHRDNIQEYDKDKVIFHINNSQFPYTTLYFHDDIKEDCFRILGEIKETKGWIICHRLYHYEGKIFVVQKNQNFYPSKPIFREEGNFYIDVKRLL